MKNEGVDLTAQARLMAQMSGNYIVRLDTDTHEMYYSFNENYQLLSRKSIKKPDIAPKKWHGSL